MYRLIACDLDETLLTKDKTVTTENYAAIKNCERQGAYFVPATGRGYYSILRTLKELEADGRNNHFMIGFNGGVVIENAGPTIIKATPLAFDLVEAIFEVGSQFNVAIHLYTLEQTYVFHTNPDEQHYMRAIPHQEMAADDLAPLKAETFYKMLFQNLDRSYLESIEAAFPPALAKQLEFSYSSNRYLEINPAGVTKGAALKALAAHLGIPMSETIAIGDNSNDLSMIETAAIGAAVNNAIPQIKAAAQFIAEKTSEDSAVAEVLEHFITET